MSVAAARKRDFFGTVSGAYLIGPADTGLITLVPGALPYRIRIQKIHVEVTAPVGAELWTFQDGAGIPIVPNISAAAIAHFDFNFGPDGVPCSVGTAFVLNITGATGARGWITWEAARSDQVMPPNYSATVLADRPVGYWRLGESSGTVAIDSSNGGHPGTYVGGVTLAQTGPLVDGNTAALFDGTSGYVSVPHVAALAPTGDFSVEAWIKLSGLTEFDIVNHYGTGNFSGFLFAVSEAAVDGRLNFWTGGAWFVSTSPVNNGQWHHVVATLTGTTARLSIDGALDASGPTPVTLTPVTAALEIGRRHDTSAYAAGLIDDVAIYPTALSPERIAQHYREGLAR